jgi:hypothetical protein
MMRRGLEGICLLALVGLAVSLAAQGRRGAEESLSVEDYTPRSTLCRPGASGSAREVSSH